MDLLQRDFGDKRVFSERRRNDSYAEEEPEWFSGGPTSQSETIELIGFDDKILEDDKRKSKRSRKRAESLKEGMSKPCSSGSQQHNTFHHVLSCYNQTLGCMNSFFFFLKGTLRERAIVLTMLTKNWRDCMQSS